MPKRNAEGRTLEEARQGDYARRMEPFERAKVWRDRLGYTAAWSLVAALATLLGTGIAALVPHVVRAWLGWPLWGQLASGTAALAVLSLLAACLLDWWRNEFYPEGRAPGGWFA